jgi:hypothetical protein
MLRNSRSRHFLSRRGAPAIPSLSGTGAAALALLLLGAALVALGKLRS